MGFSKQLAEKIVALDESHLDDAVLLEIKRGIVDVVGVTLAGSLEDCAKIALLSVGGGTGGPAQIIGSNARAAVLDAAVVNGTAGHALDFDDCNNAMGGHPSAPAFAAVAALADELNASGVETMLAYLAGYETEVQMGPGLHPHHYNKGWHPTATFGTFGATAAGAKLLKLDVEQTATALGIACSLAAGVKANFGTMVKPLHVGQAARNGLFAAILAKNGFDASPEAFEHKQGFFEVFNGAGTYQSEKILEEWGAPFKIMNPGLAIKQHPCCGGTHTAVDAMLALRDKHGLTPDTVAKIESWTHQCRMAHTDRPNPRSELEGKFSVQYCMSRALMHGEVKMEHFENGAAHDADVRAVLAKVTSEEHQNEGVFQAIVAVTTTDGMRFEQNVDMAEGRGANQLSQEKLKRKFDNTAARALPAERVAQAYETIMTLDEVASFRALSGLLASSVNTVEQAAE
ncbi:MAG: MmgE/PrpD family protein [Proteobacteria bacterium]|nr:MmgE/PrpD family protein [Pseudomonadota bacterium]